MGSYDFLDKIKLNQDITLVKIYDSIFKMTFNHQQSYFLNFDFGIYFLIFKVTLDMLETPNKSPQIDSLFKIT